jgi:hypothetical protein
MSSIELTCIAAMGWIAVFAMALYAIFVPHWTMFDPFPAVTMWLGRGPQGVAIAAGMATVVVFLSAWAALKP